MKVNTGICLRDWSIEGIDDQKPQGDQLTTFTLKRGEEYTISQPRDDGTVVVFTTYWLRVPSDLFGGVQPL